MKRIANRDAAYYTTNRIDFQGSNLSGKNTDYGYVVYSYGWWVLYEYRAGEDQWYENLRKYSRSTNKHSTQARPITNKPMKKYG